MKTKPFSFKEFSDLYSKVPRLCVDVVIKTSKGVLLSKRNIPPAKGMWHFPGGTVLFGETLEQTAKRVAKEELGIDVVIKEQIGVIQYDKKYAIGQSVSVAYSAEPKSDKFQIDEETTEVKYFKKIPSETIPDTAEFLLKKFKMK